MNSSYLCERESLYYLNSVMIHHRTYVNLEAKYQIFLKAIFDQ